MNKCDDFRENLCKNDHSILHKGDFFMIKIIAFIILCVTLWTVGCSRPPENNINDNNGQNNVQNEQQDQQDQPQNGSDPITDPSDDTPETQTAEGRITSITRNDGGIVSLRILSENKDEYLINVPTAPDTELKLGDRVTVTIDGDIAETSPMQATAQEISVNEEFGGVMQTADIYNVGGITAANLSETLRTTGQAYESFTNYEECQAYLEENGLTEKFNETVGDTDITSLTDTFFTENDLHMFIRNENSSGKEQTKEVYLQDDVLFLKITETTTDAALRNASYEIFLIPIEKGTNVTEGYILTETVLSDNLSVTDPDENLTDDPQDDEQTQEGQSSSDAESNSGGAEDQNQEQSNGENNTEETN